MPDFCLYFRIHQPVAIRKVSFFDFGSAPDLIDQKKQNNKLKRRLNQIYLPAFSILSDLISKYKGDFQLALSVNGILLDQISHFFPSHYKEIRDLMNLEEIEMIASTYFHSLASVGSLDEFRIQVTLEKKKILESTGKEPFIFCNPDMSVETSMLTILKDLRMNGILFGTRSEKQKKREPRPFVYVHPKIKNIGFLPVCETFSETFVKGAILPKCESEKLITEMVDEIRRGWNIPVVLLIDLDGPAGSEISISKRMDFLKRFVDRSLNTGEIHFQLPSQLIGNPEGIQERIVVDRLVLENDPLQKMNMLVKEAMRYLYSLEKRIKRSKDQNLLFQWRILQSYDYLQKFNRTGGQQGGEFSGSEASITPHETYLDFMNALTALDIYIKN